MGNSGSFGGNRKLFQSMVGIPDIRRQIEPLYLIPNPPSCRGILAAVSHILYKRFRLTNLPR